MRTAYRALVESCALPRGLDADLVEALILVESSDNPWAWNPEPRYRYLWHVKQGGPFRKLTAEERASEFPPPDFRALAGDADQEWWGQQASWGLMQIMGAVAREQGFRGDYLTELVMPEMNVTIGCGILESLHAWAGGNEARMLGAYNAGRGGYASPAGRAYAAKVLAMREKVRA